jgi:hypothetical protein
MMYGLIYTIVLCFTHKSFIRIPGFPSGNPSERGFFDWQLFTMYIVWQFISRGLKLYYYLWEYPRHILYIPLFLIFQYAQALIRLYALLTLYERGWGTRKIEVKGNEIVRSIQIPKLQTQIAPPPTQEIITITNNIAGAHAAEELYKTERVTPENVRLEV